MLFRLSQSYRNGHQALCIIISYAVASRKGPALSKCQLFNGSSSLGVEFAP